VGSSYRGEHFMSISFFETKPRVFNPLAVSGLTKEALEGANAALKELASWRNEIADTNQKYGERVIDQMAVAGKTLGWPAQIVDAARTQLKSVAEIQVKTMDQVMDAWEEQLKLPNPMTASPSAMLSKLTSLPGTPAAAGNPIEVWMKLAEQWQRTWVDMFGATGKRQ
jgi:K+-transporting ATPase c subunit